MPKRNIEDNISFEVEEPTEGVLYIVSTPIGNFEDITLRALRILKSCDVVICEEIKEAAILMKRLNITKKLETLNEQDEMDNAAEYIGWLKEGKKLALISDAGTPVFADPGLYFVRLAMEAGINIEVVPGASSIMTALVRSGFSLDQFLFAGFMSRQPDERIQQLKELAKESRTVVFLETPYRLMAILEAANVVMPDRQAYIGINLTMPYETHHYGTFRELYERFSESRFRGEFVICIEGKEVHRSEEDGNKRISRSDSRPAKKGFGKKPFGSKTGSRDFKSEPRSSRPRREYSDRDYDSPRPERKPFRQRDDMDHSYDEQNESMEKAPGTRKVINLEKKEPGIWRKSSDDRRPRSSDEDRPRSSDDRRSRSSDDRRSRSSDEGRPRFSDDRRSRSSDDRKPRSSDDRRPRSNSEGKERTFKKKSENSSSNDFSDFIDQFKRRKKTSGSDSKKPFRSSRDGGSSDRPPRSDKPFKSRSSSKPGNRGSKFGSPKGRGTGRKGR